MQVAGGRGCRVGWKWSYMEGGGETLVFPNLRATLALLGEFLEFWRAELPGSAASIGEVIWMGEGRDRDVARTQVSYKGKSSSSPAVIWIHFRDKDGA